MNPYKNTKISRELTLRVCKSGEHTVISMYGLFLIKLN